MAENSKIEWTDHTGNLWWGCTEVHAGCDNCYAKVLDNRWGGSHWGNGAPRRAVKSIWKDFKRWQKQASDEGVIKRVFVGSMMDIAEKPMSIVDIKGNVLPSNTGELRDKFFKEVVPNSPNLLFLLLSKRPSNFNKYIPDSWKINPPDNVMFGTSPVNQETADKLIPQLLKVRGKRFLSIEPQLGAINLLFRPDSIDPNCVFKKEFYRYIDCFNWIIQGGESGHYKRPFNLEWAYDLKKQCEIANKPYFFKQIDKIQPIPEDLLIKQFPA